LGIRFQSWLSLLFHFHFCFFGIKSPTQPDVRNKRKEEDHALPESDILEIFNSQGRAVLAPAGERVLVFRAEKKGSRGVPSVAA
jgi:hypothetical protein